MEYSKKKKLIIGTAQFGSSYGISNTNGRVRLEEIKKIFEISHDHGVSKIDTAVRYGVAENNIGKLNLKNFDFISKITFEENNIEVNKWAYNETKKILARISQKSLYALLLHEPNVMLKNLGQDIYNSLLNLKTKKLVKKIGLSANNMDDILPIIDKYHFDVVQIPLNVFDRRAIDSGIIKYLKNKNIEVHVRSIFLQGLLLMKKKERSQKFSSWKKHFYKWDTWLINNKISPLQACLQFICSIDDIDYIVIGVQNTTELSEIFNQTFDVAKLSFNDLSVTDLNLIDPSKWKSL